MKPIRQFNKYSKDERYRILKEIECGKITLKNAARKYGMSPSGIIYWKIHFGMRNPHGKKEKQKLSPSQLEDPQTQRIRQLEHDVEKLKLKLADLYLENDLLKKLEIFSQTKRKQSSCIVTAENLSQFLAAAEKS